MSKFLKSKCEFLNFEIPKLVKEGKCIREISKILDISKSTVIRRCKNLGINVPNYHNALKFDNTVFDNINTEEKAYWLGFLYADGNVSNTTNIVSISLKGDDFEHLEKFRKFLKSSANVRRTFSKIKDKKYPICTFSVCDKHLKQRLIRLGCLPKKSLILTFPRLEIFEDPTLVYDFIRGYIDGNGCLTFSKNGRLNLSILGTKEFLTGIELIFPEMFSLYKAKRIHTNTWTLSNCGEKADEVTYKLYSKATIYLDRKYDRFAVLNRKI